MMRSRRRPPLLLLTVLAALIAIPVHLALGVEGIPADNGTEASRMTWPEGATLLAAAELSLPAGSYDWQVTTLALTEDETAFISGNGVLVTASGNALTQLNGRETIRLERNAALTMGEGDRWQLRAADDERATALAIELVSAGAAHPGDDVAFVGPLDVPGGNATMVLVDLDKDLAADSAPDEVMQGALRPGVSIRHDQTGVPVAPEPNQPYDRWIVALFPHGGGQSAPIATQPPTTPLPATSPTMPATPTATAPGTPTYTPTSTPTEPMPTATWTPTPTPTEPMPTATWTPTPTPTEPMPTATWTPTPTPTEVPESGVSVEAIFG